MRVGTPAPSGPAGGRIIKHSPCRTVQPRRVMADRLALRGRLTARRTPTAIPAVGTKEAPAAIINYTVQKGETLWDVAVQHGVSMRTIKDLNKLTGTDAPLTEGQQLLVPASGMTTVGGPDGAASAAALGTTPARGLWVGSEHVRLATIWEAKQLYLRQCDRGNSQNTLLVLYAPWCPHCRDIEDELERLAEGLSHVPSVRVVAVNGDSVEGRIFAREVLGVAYYPSIVSFPEHSRTFYKYKGRQRDAESLLRFLNMTCCAREDQMWTLRPAGTHPMLAGGFGQGGPLQLLAQISPVGTSPSALGMALAGVTMLGLGGLAWWRARAQAEAGVAPDIVAELDSSLSRMAQLMVRAVGTRVALLLGLVRPTAATAPEASAVPATVSSNNGAASNGAAPPAPLAAPVEVEVMAPALTGLGHSPGSSVAGSGSWDSTQTWEVGPIGSIAVPMAAVATTAPAFVGTAPAAATATVVAASAAVAADLASGGPARELTAEERMRLTRLTDDELIALVNSDPDLDKVLSRLLGDK